MLQQKFRLNFFIMMVSQRRNFLLVREIKDQLKDSPSLKPYILEIFDTCYQEGRAEASDRSKLPIDKFPIALIGSLEQILDENWFPEYNHNHHDEEC